MEMANRANVYFQDCFSDENPELLKVINNCAIVLNEHGQDAIANEFENNHSCKEIRK